MRIFSFPMIFLLAALVVLRSFASAQDTKAGEPRPDVQQPSPNQQDVRGNMLRQLGLSPEQIQQIRRINQERKPLMEEAQRRFREANRSLNEAIYANEVNDADFQARLKEVQVAQADIQRLRFTNELAVRRILTPEQLVRFRDLRDRFEKERQNLEQARPFRNMRQIERRVSPNEQRPANQPARLVKQDQPKPNQ
jgi:Spy/CpxP family protein refolding chaperone